MDVSKLLRTKIDISKVQNEGFEPRELSIDQNNI